MSGHVEASVSAGSGEIGGDLLSKGIKGAGELIPSELFLAAIEDFEKFMPLEGADGGSHSVH